jgi:hypothetical protein
MASPAGCRVRDRCAPIGQLHRKPADVQEIRSNIDPVAAIRFLVLRMIDGLLEDGHRPVAPSQEEFPLAWRLINSVRISIKYEDSLGFLGLMMLH